VTTGVDRALTVSRGQRPNQVLANAYGDKSGRPLTGYLNPAAFALSTLGTLGIWVAPILKVGNLAVSTRRYRRYFRLAKGKNWNFEPKQYNVTKLPARESQYFAREPVVWPDPNLSGSANHAVRVEICLLKGGAIYLLVLSLMLDVGRVPKNRLTCSCFGRLGGKIVDMMDRTLLACILCLAVSVSLPAQISRDCQVRDLRTVIARQAAARMGTSVRRRWDRPLEAGEINKDKLDKESEKRPVDRGPARV